MAKVAKNRERFNAVPLGRWVDQPDRRSTPRAVRKIADRFGLPFAIALATAALAGIPVEVRDDR
jgi:hypothetical protein